MNGGATQAEPLCCMFTCYNEEARLPLVLAHALCWADEILVVDKGSTDRTVEIARSYGERVRVLSVPYTPQGDDDLATWCREVSSDWIFGITCSEIPTREVVAQARRLIPSGGIDLVYVPRRIYSFGSHHPTSPWSISYYPFLFHRQRAVIRNEIHNQLSATHPSRTAKISYTPICCVHHFTHSSAASFIEVVAGYAKVEAAQWDHIQIPSKLVNSFAAVRRALPGIMRCGVHAPTILSAWCIYHFALVLHGMERLQGGPAHSVYRAEKHAILEREWGHAGSAPSSQGPAPVVPQLNAYAIVPLLRLVCLLCMVLLFLMFPSYIIDFVKRMVRRIGRMFGRVWWKRTG